MDLVRVLRRVVPHRKLLSGSGEYEEEDDADIGFEQWLDAPRSGLMHLRGDESDACTSEVREIHHGGLSFGRC